MKKEINKWQIHFTFSRDYFTFARGWKQFIFGIFKLHTLPQEGEMITSKDYKGFIIKFYIWLPIDS